VRLRERDQRWVEALQQEIDTHRLEARSVWPSFLPLLARVLELSVLVAYGVERTEADVRLAFVEASLTGRRRALAVRAFKRGFASHAARPEVALEVLAEALGLKEPERLQLTMWKQGDLTVCLAALGVTSRVLSRRDRLVLHHVLPALQRRLEFERRLLMVPVHKAAVEACLATLDVPAAIIDSVGQIHVGNALALEQNERGVSPFELAPRGMSGFDVTPLRKGGARHYLAIAQRPVPNPEAQLSAAAQTWRLTARETQTLALVAEGLSSLSIAARLGCAERTAEVHVGRLLAKAGCKSRSQLIARFWSAEDFAKQAAP
jgi:DNA-binding CsgD family transcriptional regulator